MIFEDWSALLRVLLMAAAAYATLVVFLRLTGKRALSKLNAFDLVVTVALGSTLATILLSKDVTLAEGALAMAMLLALQWLVSRLSIASNAVSQLVRSEPRLIFENGDYRDAAMADERVTRSEVDAAIRRRGHGKLADVAAVVLETDGSMSVIAGGDSDRMSALGSVRR